MCQTEAGIVNAQ
ncbi:type III secretion flagellar biosynthesis translocase domain protein, partial [Chlamydia psittaci 06-1683]